MAEPNKVEISVDAKTDDAKKELDETAKKVSLVGKAGQTAMAALRGLGRLHFAISGVERIVTFFKNLAGNAAEAREEARRFAAEQEKAADGKKVSELSDAYRQLSENISAAASARKNANEIEDMERSSERKLEDDLAEADKAAEIAALDQDDPLFERKKAKIEAKYSGEKAVRSAKRAQADAETNEERTWSERSAKIEEADNLRWSAREDREESDRLRRRAKEASAASVAENEEDNSGFWSVFGSNVKKIVSGQWSKIGDERTEEGDRLRSEYAEEAKRLEAAADALEAKAIEKEKKASDADTEAEHLAGKAAAYGRMSANQTVAIRNAEDAAAAGNANADKALASDEARRASALAASEDLARQAEELKARIAAEQQKKDAANQTVWQAGNTLEVAKLSGGRGAAPAAQALHDAQAAANEVNFAADKAINALTETLKGVEERLKAASNYLKNAESRNRDAWADGNAAGS